MLTGALLANYYQSSQIALLSTVSINSYRDAFVSFAASIVCCGLLLFYSLSLMIRNQYSAFKGTPPSGLSQNQSGNTMSLVYRVESLS